MRELLTGDVFNDGFFEEFPEVDEEYDTEDFASTIMAALRERFEMDEDFHEHIYCLIEHYGNMRFAEGQLAKYFPWHYDIALDKEEVYYLSRLMNEEI